MINLDPKVSIIIPCFNGWKYTNECLISVFNSTYCNFDVILVNDGSTDETSSALREFFPQVIEVNGNGNLWWSKSMNLGFEIAKGLSSEYVLVLNNDVILENGLSVGTYLKAFHGAPVFTESELKIFCECSEKIGLQLDSKIPKDKDLISYNGNLGKHRF